MDDVALVQRATALDKDAFGVVYERYATRLYDYLWWVLQDREEAAYALYDTFLEAGARLGELRDPAKLRPWLFAIASDQALGRRRRRDKGEAAARTVEADDGADADPAWGELKHVVRAIAVDLSPEDRALLDLRYRQGLEDEELAEAVGTTPDRAADLLERLTERVETLLGETVVAFLARTDCPALTELLGPWDDRLDAAQRELVEEHAPACAICSERRQRRIPASALLGVTPPVPVPGGVGPRVLEDVDLAAHHGRPWAARRNGFPPPLIGARHRQRLAVGAAAAAVLLVLAAAAFIVGRGGGTQEVASTGASSVPSTTIRTSTTFTTLVTPTSTPLPTPGDAAAALPGVATTRPAGGAGGGGGGSGGGGGTGGGGGGSAAPADAPADTAPSDATSDTTTPTTAPTPTSPPTTADTVGPTISGLSVSPSTVRAGSGCPGGDPATATVTATVSDNSGVASVRIVLAGLSSASIPMASSGGGSYSAVVGPFESLLPSGGGNLPGQVVVQATDTAGNQTVKSAGLTLRCA